MVTAPPRSTTNDAYGDVACMGGRWTGPLDGDTAFLLMAPGKTTGMPQADNTANGTHALLPPCITTQVTGHAGDGNGTLARVATPFTHSVASRKPPRAAPYRHALVAMHLGTAVYGCRAYRIALKPSLLAAVAAARVRRASIRRTHLRVLQLLYAGAGLRLLCLPSLKLRVASCGSMNNCGRNYASIYYMVLSSVDASPYAVLGEQQVAWYTLPLATRRSPPSRLTTYPPAPHTYTAHIPPHRTYTPTLHYWRTCTDGMGAPSTRMLSEGQARCSPPNTHHRPTLSQRGYIVLPSSGGDAPDRYIV